MATKHGGSERERRALNLFIKLNRARASVGRRVHAPLQAAGLTDTQFGVLDAISHHGALPVSGLAEKNLCSPNSLSAVIDTMERHGLVERRRSAPDRRVVEVDLTERGRALYKAVWPQHLERIVEASAHLTPEEMATLDVLLRKLGRGSESTS